MPIKTFTGFTSKRVSTDEFSDIDLQVNQFLEENNARITCIPQMKYLDNDSCIIVVGFEYLKLS